MQNDAGGELDVEGPHPERALRRDADHAERFGQQAVELLTAASPAAQSLRLQYELVVGELGEFPLPVADGANLQGSAGEAALSRRAEEPPYRVDKHRAEALAGGLPGPGAGRTDVDFGRQGGTHFDGSPVIMVTDYHTGGS